MRILKYRAFHQWAKSEKLTDSALKVAISEMEQGLFEANLGGGLYKKGSPEKDKESEVDTEQLLPFSREIALFLCMVLRKVNEITLVARKKVCIKN